MKSAFYIALVLLLFAGCKKEHAFDCLKSTGKEIVETRALEKFTEFKVFGNIQVKLIQAAEHKVEIRAGEHLIKGIATEVKNGVLSVENQNTCNIVRGYKREVQVLVYAPILRKVTNEGVGTVHMDENFVQDSLSVKINSSGDFYVEGNYKHLRSESNGNGDMHLNGSAESLYLNTSGTNYVYAKGLKINSSMFVVTRTLGDVYLTASNLMQFEYNINGKGNIYLYGSPSVIRNNSEPGYSGQLIQAQ